MLTHRTLLLDVKSRVECINKLIGGKLRSLINVTDQPSDSDNNNGTPSPSTSSGSGNNDGTPSTPSSSDSSLLENQ